MDNSAELTESQDFPNMPAQSQIPIKELTLSMNAQRKVDEVELIEELPLDLEAPPAIEVCAPHDDPAVAPHEETKEPEISEKLRSYLDEQLEDYEQR